MKKIVLCMLLAACANEETATPTAEQKQAVVPGSTIAAELHFDRGVALAAQGRYTEAIEAYLIRGKVPQDGLSC